MNFKTFMSLLLKIFALYFIVGMIKQIPILFQSLTMFGQESFYGFYSGIGFFLISLGIIMLYFLAARLLIRKSDWIIEKIFGKSEFEADFTNFKIHRSVILSIAIIVIGGITLIDIVPVFLKDVFYFISYLRTENDSAISYFDKHTFMDNKKSIESLIISSLQLIIALFLIFKNTTIVNWIELKRKSKIAPNEVDTYENEDEDEKL